MSEFPPAPTAPPPDPRRRWLDHVWRGAWGFGLVGMLVYASVAYGERALYRTLTVGGAYALWTSIFVLGAPWVLGRLLIEREQRPRFVGAFILGFLAYAGTWMLIYFGLRSRTAEVASSILAPATMAAVYAWAIARNQDATPMAAMAVLVCHTAGYFLGSLLNRLLGGSAGMLAWGIAHCCLFGAGIGWMIALIPRRAGPAAAVAAAHET